MSFDDNVCWWAVISLQNIISFKPSRSVCYYELAVLAAGLELFVSRKFIYRYSGDIPRQSRLPMVLTSSLP
jgi:hypothetical protein